MILEILDLLECAGCRARPLDLEIFEADVRGNLIDGVVWCRSCGRWYPVDDGLLEYLVEALSYVDDRERFWLKHRARFRLLGLARSVTVGDSLRGGEIRHQQAHFDWYADNPTQTYSEYEQLRFWQALDSITFARWRRGIRPGARLLDIGCAQGRSTFKLVGPDLEIVAFDISKALVRSAMLRATEDARVTFLVADASSLPFVDESFDYALTYGVLHHLPDPAKVCRDVARVIRPGGTFFASENNRSLARAAFELLQRVRPLWHEEAGEYAQISRDQLDDWLSSAGFSPSIRTSVFFPPHALNHLPQSVGERVLGLTDRLGNAIPGLRANGGLVVSEAVKNVAGE